MPNDRSFFYPPDDQPPRRPALGQLPRVLLYAAGQLAFFFILLQLYKLARKAFIPPDPEIAYTHARSVLRFEERLGLMFELDLQRWVLDQGDWRSLHRYYDTTVMIDVPEDELRRRLSERWKDLDPEAFAFKMEENDIPNGRLVRTASIAAEFTVRQ